VKQSGSVYKEVSKSDNDPFKLPKHKIHTHHVHCQSLSFKMKFSIFAILIAPLLASASPVDSTTNAVTSPQRKECDT
jgi:hypothetical protein